MLVANENIVWSILFCIASAFSLALLGFSLRDVVSQQEEMPEGRSRAHHVVNQFLLGYMIFAGIAMAVIVFFVGVSIPATLAWIFIVFLVFTAIVAFAGAWCNMDSAGGLILYIISMALIYLLLHDLVVALHGDALAHALAACLPITTIGFGVAKYVWDYGKYRQQKTAGRKGRGLTMLSVIFYVITVILLVTTILFGALFGILFPNQLNPGQDDEIASAGITDDDIAGFVAMLSADISDEDLEWWMAKYSDRLSTSSLGVTDTARHEKSGFSDAVTFPFESDEPDEMMEEVYWEVFHNPIYAQMIAKGMKDKTIPGMEKSIGEYATCMPELLSKKWHEWCYKDTEGVIRVTREYRLLAARLCNILREFIPQGIQKHQTVENWRLNTPVDRDSERDTMPAEYQYNDKSALILAYVTKDKAGTKDIMALFVFGLNVHDKRIEFYGENDEPEVTKTSSSEGGSTPSGGGDTPSNPDTPKVTPTESPSPKPTEPRYNKDKSLSDNSGTNDNPGEGKSTNNGEGARGSTDDVNGGNGTPRNYYEEEQRHEADNASANKSSTPSYDGGGGTIDNPGGSDDRPSSTPKDPEIANDTSNQHWDTSGI